MSVIPLALNVSRWCNDMKKAEYELLPIYDTHVFYTNDLDLVKKLIKKKYKKANMI